MSVWGLVKKVIAREEWHPFFTYPLFLLRVARLRYGYARLERNCREKRRQGRKLKVLFLVSNCSKWKAQSLYETFANGSVFDPLLAITFCDDESYLSDAELQARIDADASFYERLGVKWAMACEVKTRTVFDLRRFEPDVVFFQVPWGLMGEQRVCEVARHALTCYIPYALECFDQARRKSRRFDFNHMANFQQLLWLFTLVSEKYAAYTRQPHFGFERAGRVMGLGHTALDPFSRKGAGDADGDLVIFAPHFSFPWNGVIPIMNHSTFHWSGKPMLEYAKAHPEIKWAFKPHPLLRGRLIENGFMTEAEVDRYYREWEQVGIACYDGGYADLFRRSRALITDSGSFLLEYMAVGQPLIRLEPTDFNMRFSPVFRRVLESFYTCRSVDEMLAALKMVVEDRQDPRCDERRAAAREAGLYGNDAAGRISAYLSERLEGCRPSGEMV